MKVYNPIPKYLYADCVPRFWEDAAVNGEDDLRGTMMPFRFGDHWKVKIDVQAGKIVDWPQGTIAYVHYKVCDEGEYLIVDEDGEPCYYKEGYVPPIMDPSNDGYGDYVIMEVGADGTISGFSYTHEGMDACFVKKDLPIEEAKEFLRTFNA